MRDRILQALLAVMRGREGAPPMPDSMLMKCGATVEELADAFGPLLAAAQKAGNERPMLTEWRKGDDTCCDGRWWNGLMRVWVDDSMVNPQWVVMRPDGVRGAIDFAPDPESAKRAADEAAQQWYRLPSSDDPRQTTAYREGAALAARVRDGGEVDGNGVRARAIEAVAKGHRWDAADVKRAMKVQPNGWLARMVGVIEHALREERARASSPLSPYEVPGVLAVVEAETCEDQNGECFVDAMSIDLPTDAPDRVNVAILAPGSDVAHAADAITRVKALLDEADKVRAPVVSVDALRAVLGK